MRKYNSVEELLLPFQFSFIINALIISLVISIPTALLSCYMILRRWSLMGDAIAHATLPGIAIAYFFKIHLIIGAFLSGMICTLVTEFLKENCRIKQDTIMGVIFSGMFGLGIVLYAKIRPGVHLDHILFGNILGISVDDIMLSTIVAIGVTVVIALKWRDLLLDSFDSIQARIVGLPVRLIRYGLLSMIALSIISALKAVGIILVMALLVTPGTIALLITQRFSTMLVVATLVAIFSSFSGVYLSFFLDSAPAPTIVLIMIMIFITVFAKNRIRIFQ
ncbi:metal ABC transporter permease [Candidatus Endowatersipora endosymbiont of Watersipora subatra]|uniref:metal ABC transporter permease n=1 Tax=Candidatus Endowatersipora endosymbiont of Watersipora subatra TaxID=3077946 RepID=UPI00312CA913